MTFQNKVPNLFVIGAPKAGTTSLFHWLGDHPEIGKSVENELRFLMDQRDPLCRPDGFHTAGLEGYARFYEDSLANSGRKYLIDVSPQYYYQDTALAQISALPESQVIMMLRKPSARIYSLYNYSKNNKVALDADMGFSDFVNEIRLGDDSDILRDRPMLRFAIKHSEYAPYIRNWKSAIGTDRLGVYLFEDLVQNPRLVLRRIAERLGVAREFYDSYTFPAQNTSYSLRHRGLHKVLHRFRKKMPGWVRQTLKPAYLYLNTRRLERNLSEEDRRTLERLDAEFVETEQELAQILGREEAIWSR